MEIETQFSSFQYFDQKSIIARLSGQPFKGEGGVGGVNIRGDSLHR